MDVEDLLVLVWQRKALSFVKSDDENARPWLSGRLRRYDLGRSWKDQYAIEESES